MPGSRPPYPREFRDEAVRLARESGKPLAQIARDLGVAYESLRHWLKQADLDTGRRIDGLTTEEREELRGLRRENRVLREEREILKKVPHAAEYGTSDRMNVVVGESGWLDAPMEMRPTPLGAASPQKSLALATAWHHDMSLPPGKHAG